MNISRINKFNLDKFISWVDQQGGPEILNQPEIQSSFKYSTNIKLKNDVDPGSDEYLDFQLKVYQELSNRDVNQELNEQTEFDVGPHIQANNPYNINDPSNFVFHYIRLGKVIQQANLNRNPKILDMGCGWGLSSEFLATLGAQVTSVDINPNFISLINQRSKFNSFHIHTVLSSFGDFFTTEKYDGILFYECLHHSIYIKKLINKLKYFLKPGGVIMLAGEPIQSMYWDSWGMRLDALSVYCIRKFGWYESGWSEEYIKELFVSNGFSFDMIKHKDPVIGYTVVARLDAKIHHVQGFVNSIEHIGWYSENDFLVSSGKAKITNFSKLFHAEDHKQDDEIIILSIFNFSPDNIECKVKYSDSSRTVVFEPGHNTLELTTTESNQNELVFESSTWKPSDIIENNQDDRVMSFHLYSIELK